MIESYVFAAFCIFLADLEINLDQFSGPKPHKLDYVGFN